MYSNGLVNIIKCCSCTSMQRPATYCNSTAASEEHMLFVTSALLFCKFGLLLCQFETLDENATWKLGDGLGAGLWKGELYPCIC